MDEKIGVYICECGPNIGDKIDIDRLIRSISSHENVVVDRHKLLCSPDGKEFLKERIKTDALTHLVVGACSPKQHEATFMKVCEDAGLNPYLFQMINIREQCAWVTENITEATEKAERLILAGFTIFTFEPEAILSINARNVWQRTRTRREYCLSFA